MTTNHTPAEALEYAKRTGRPFEHLSRAQVLHALQGAVQEAEARQIPYTMPDVTTHQDACESLRVLLAQVQRACVLADPESRESHEALKAGLRAWMQA
jgi:predicted metal-dependent hydrolase